MAERECGSCTLCCKLLGVKELNKPQGEWCKHCDIGKGCKIYDSRPNECRNFTCMWIVGMLPEEMKPDKVHAVFTVTKDNTISVDVDLNRPDVYKNGLVKMCIDKLDAQGNKVLVYSGIEEVLEIGT